MAYRNHRTQFNGYGNQRNEYGNRINRTSSGQYNGPYPPHEIAQARHLLHYQYHNSNGRALRTLRQMMNNTQVNFFHIQQIESVIPASFSAVQEEAEADFEPVDSLNQDKSENDNSESGNGPVKRKIAEIDIDIHKVEETDNARDTQNSTNSTAGAESSRSKSPKSATVTSELNDNEGPPTKRQRLSTDSTEIVEIDSNGNIDNDAVTTDNFVVLDNVGFDDNSNDSSNVVIDEEGNVVISSDDGEEDAEEEIQTQLCLMCDLCLFVIRGKNQVSKQKMKSHLKTTKHSAASLIEAKIEGDKTIPRFVQEKHFVVNFNNSDCDILPVCPECSQIHPNVWVCALHYQQLHDKNEENTYGLGKVVNREICQVSASHFCQKCKNTFPSASKLHRHWKTQKHYPFKEPAENQIVQYKCEQCSYKELSFLTCRAHILSAHSEKLKNRDIDMSILYLERTDKLTLLPRKSSFYDQVLEDNKKLVKQTIKQTRLNRKQRRKLRKTVLPTTQAMVEYKYGKNFNEDKERYEKYLKGYDRYHYSQKS